MGAVAYDQRILSWKGHHQISLLTMSGRVIVPVVYQGRWSATAGVTRRGQADLIYREGVFYLAVVIDVPEPPCMYEPDEWLGVDLGIVNLATDSKGKVHCGKGVRAVAQRADLHSWSFRQLRTFITYKAALAGVPLRLADPRNTSRVCHRCGHCDKRNRPTRDDFACIRCGFAGPADHNAAINIGRRAAVSQPYAA